MKNILFNPLNCLCSAEKRGTSNKVFFLLALYAGYFLTNQSIIHCYLLGWSAKINLRQNIHMSPSTQPLNNIYVNIYTHDLLKKNIDKTYTKKYLILESNPVFALWSVQRMGLGLGLELMTLTLSMMLLKGIALKQCPALC